MIYGFIRGDVAGNKRTFDKLVQHICDDALLFGTAHPTKSSLNTLVALIEVSNHKVIGAIRITLDKPTHMIKIEALNDDLQHVSDFPIPADTFNSTTIVGKMNEWWN